MQQRQLAGLPQTRQGRETSKTYRAITRLGVDHLHSILVIASLRDVVAVSVHQKHDERAAVKEVACSKQAPSTNSSSVYGRGHQNSSGTTGSSNLCARGNQNSRGSTAHHTDTPLTTSEKWKGETEPLVVQEWPNSRDRASVLKVWLTFPGELRTESAGSDSSASSLSKNTTSQSCPRTQSR
jgi:hypothetical protein